MTKAILLLHGFATNKTDFDPIIDELNNDLSLKNDKNIYFLGEMIDVDGKCGGYNIYFALASGYYVGSKI